VHGIEVQTEKTWQYANEFLLPRFMVINKIDKEHADFGHALETAASSFARSIVPFTLPIGKEGNFKGVVDVVHQKHTSSTQRVERKELRSRPKVKIFSIARVSGLSRSSRSRTTS
jgi:translation elongation factor EF-G